MSDGTGILIIDDDPSVGNSLRLIFQKEGYQVKWAPTGTDGIQFMHSQWAESLTAVLIDMRLPDMTGLDVLKSVKKIMPDVGAVMITGHTDLDTALGALNEGAFAYLQKPYSVIEVKSCVKKLMEKREMAMMNQILYKKMLELNSRLEDKVRRRTEEFQTANLRLADAIERLCAIDAVKSMRAEEILSLSEAGAGAKLSYESFSLKSLMEQIAQDPQISGAGIKFEVVFEEGLENIVSDKSRVRQIMAHLLKSASDLSSGGGNPKVRVRRGDKGPEIVISIAGPGFPPEDREKVFEPFYLGRSAAAGKKLGVGLDLTISKAIADALGGGVEAAADSEEGSGFVLSLPSNSGPESSPASPPVKS